MSGNAEAYNSFAGRILSTIRKALQMKLVSRGAGLPCKLPTEAFLPSTRSAGGGVGFKHKRICAARVVRKESLLLQPGDGKNSSSLPRGCVPELM